MEQREINVLALHGYQQNRDIFEHSMRSLFRGKVCERIRFIIPQAPLRVDDEEDRWGWWTLPSKDHVAIPHEYDRMEESVACVLEAVGKDRVDAVIGFSQGTIVATVLLSRGLLPDCRLAILISASGIQCERFVPKHKIDTPVVLLVGEKDTLCPEEYSRKLAESYERVEWMMHRHGHVVPSGAIVRDHLMTRITKSVSPEFTHH